MVLTELLSKEVGSIEGVIDTGVVVIAHFDNPARKPALREKMHNPGHGCLGSLPYDDQVPRCRGDRGFQSINQNPRD